MSYPDRKGTDEDDSRDLVPLRGRSTSARPKVNRCHWKEGWLSQRDSFAVFSINATSRHTKNMLKKEIGGHFSKF